MKYYKINNSCIDGKKSTEKATAVIVGTNGCVTKAKLRYFYTLIANSQIKIIDNNLYAPYWIIKGLKDAIDWNDFIEIEEEKKVRKPRKTKEEKEQEWYDTLFKNNFTSVSGGTNGELPNEYIEYWFEGMETISEVRFTTIDKLQGRLSKDDIIKINIVRNGEREVIRG